MLALLKHVDSTLASPENAFLDPVEREIERSRLFADVLVAYARLVMGRRDVQTPFEGELNITCLEASQPNMCRGADMEERSSSGSRSERVEMAGRQDRRVS
jgi:hypothetical protein